MPPRHQGAGGRVTGGTSVISRQQLIGLVGITLMWGINWPMMKIALREVSPMYFRGVTMGLGALWLLLYFRIQGLRLWPANRREWRDIVLINYGFAQIIWFGMARDLPPATSAMSIMAVPVVGTLSASLLIGELPHWQDYAAMVCVVLAIAAVLLPQRSPAATAA